MRRLARVEKSSPAADPLRLRPEFVNEQNFIEAVLEAAAALVIVMDREGRIVHCNRACEQVTGYRIQELRGRVFWEVFVAPEGQERSRSRLHTIFAGETSTFENEWIIKSGERRRIAFSNAPLR